MSSTKWISGLAIACAAVTMTVPVAGSAQALNDVLNAERQRTKLAQESQKRIDQVVDDTRKKEDEYKRVLKEIEGLEIYNTLVQRQIDGQMAKMEEIRTSIDQVEVINRQILPAMTRMIDGLKQFVAIDVPFLEEERTERVAKLETLLAEPNVNVAEKFRKVTEAYQIENDYGRTIEAYDGKLNIDGQDFDGEFLRIGRVSLMFQTPDGAYSRVWDQSARRWEDAAEHKNQIRQGLKIANKQIAPELVLLPVPAPEAG
ncbi:MAG: DUF3450 domain-containing protein [Gammaproteobacteria bacterium]|jgi:hypothetical protein|nr:DUF3450 domain-containing protein [Gammaproteobacteria bacterium]